jgi:dTDP-4-dehydrorhamnose 3,5-epimerase
LKVRELGLKGLLLIDPDLYSDSRGFFLESWSEHKYTAAGITTRFVQDNHSRSCRNTLRGLHYQDGPGQAKLVRVTRGHVLDVVVDIRPESPTFGQHEAVELDNVYHRQLYVPVGFAHGFVVLSDYAEFLYKVSTPYSGDLERTLAWNDPDLAIPWPVKDPVLSPRDTKGESFESYKSRTK